MKGLQRRSYQSEAFFYGHFFLRRFAFHFVGEHLRIKARALHLLATPRPAGPKHPPHVTAKDSQPQKCGAENQNLRTAKLNV